MRASSIRRKLLAALVITSMSVLLLMGLALVAYEFGSYKAATARNLSTLAQTVAANITGALLFDDEKFAREILSGLRAEPHIQSACLYDRKGKLYASWSAVAPAPERFPNAPASDGLHFSRRELELFEPVIQAGARIGTLYIKEDLGDVYARLMTYGVVVLLVIAAAAALTLLLSRLFERRITEPILALADTARRVSELKDYSLRARESSADELGQLTHAFNEMLRQIQAHQGQVQSELTARKVAEEGLRESEERFRTLADNIPQLAWMGNADGWLFWYNKRWFEYTGTTLEQMQGWGWAAVHHPDHLERVTAKFKLALERGEPWEDTFPLRNKDGQYRWFLSRAFPIRNRQGELTRWFGTNTDITELREAQEALAGAKAEIEAHADTLEQTVAQRTAELRRANENLQTFSYSAAHDLRSPLRSIRSFSKVIMDDFGATLEPTICSYLNRMIGSAEQMERLLRDLLEYSRISQAELHLEPVSLQAATHEALGLLETEIRSKNAEVAIAEPLPMVLGHRATVVLVVQNLISNALKFIPAGIQPQIRVHAEALNLKAPPAVVGNGHNGAIAGDPALDSAARPRANAPTTPFVRLVVEDNGIGIASEDIQKLFAAFQRLHGTSVYPGTGLGLAIVRKGAERMGGSVGVESQPGKGSRFWVDLPSQQG